MKSLSHDLTYPAATTADVRRMLADPEFRGRVCDAQHVLRHDVSITPGSGGSMRVVVEQVQATRGIPSFATRFVGEEITVVQEEDWTSQTEADLAVSIPGKPGRMRGTIAVAEDASGVTETVQVDITVSIPLVGGKLEGLIGDMLLAALKSENRVGRSWLGEH